jgi:hypothetical protein
MTRVTKNIPYYEQDPLPNRLITLGCLLLVFPAIFLCLALAFYLTPVLIYALSGGGL